MLLRRIRISVAMVAPARAGSCGCARMLVRLTETATMTRPAKVADAAADARKKFVHINSLSAIWIAQIALYAEIGAKLMEAQTLQRQIRHGSEMSERDACIARKLRREK